jgi:translation initiation factor aIF-2/yIF-2
MSEINVNKSDKKKKKKTGTKDKPMNPMAILALQHLKLIEEQNAKIQAIKEEEERKLKEEEDREAAKLKIIEDEKEKKRKSKQDKIQAQKIAGTYKTKTEKERIKKNKEKLELLINGSNVINTPKKSTEIIIEKSIVDNNLRSPILCIMGHVDTGKTKLLDTIRDSNVQEGEAGGITQQIGATFIPRDSLITKSKFNDIKIPGLLTIDTPGHEAFANLRSRGSSLCDVAIVVIDIVHGLEQQTIQSINMLVESNIKFVFALNKIDRLYGWTTVENRSIKESLDENQISIGEFYNRLHDITTQIMTLGLNAKLFWENNSIEDTISICPISAKTGEGVCDLLTFVINMCQNITFRDELKCIIMEKTITEGIGASIDAILIDGTLKKGDEISFQTSSGIMKTTIRNLLTPPPNKESRVKSEYIHHESVKGSIGVKIVGNDLDKAIVGSQIVFGNQEIEMKVETKFKLQDNGVTVFASTQGALEALLQFLQNECNPPIPVYEVYIGNVMKKHVNKMIINKTDKKEYSSVLAFNVDIDEEVNDLAKKEGIQIFLAEIIYHLFDQFKKYREDMINQRKSAFKSKVVFPCALQILEKNIYNKKNPLIFGVKVQDGNIHLGTPIIIGETKLVIGRVIGIQLNGKEVEVGKKGTDVCIKVETENTGITYGRHFDHKNSLYSAISRDSINILKEHFRDDINKDDAQLLMKIKGILGIN